MKKRLISLIMVLVLIISSAGAVSTAEERASEYLSSYSIALGALGDGVMEVFYSVDGTGRMEKVGARALYIYDYNGEDWIPYETQLAIDHSDFYSYNAFGHIGYAYFEGVPGIDYRVTLQAYARGTDGGSDTGSVTSNSVTCW